MVHIWATLKIKCLDAVPSFVYTKQEIHFHWTDLGSLAKILTYEWKPNHLSPTNNPLETANSRPKSYLFPERMCHSTIPQFILHPKMVQTQKVVHLRNWRAPPAPPPGVAGTGARARRRRSYLRSACESRAQRLSSARPWLRGEAPEGEPKGLEGEMFFSSRTEPRKAARLNFQWWF